MITWVGIRWMPLLLASRLRSVMDLAEAGAMRTLAPEAIEDAAPTERVAGVG